MTDEKKKVTETASKAKDAAVDAKVAADKATTGKKSHKKGWITFGIIVVVLGALFAGFMVWHAQPSFCNAICHYPMDPYGEGYYSTSKAVQTSELAATHANVKTADGQSVTCLSCHVPTLPQQMSEGMHWVSGSYDYNYSMDLLGARRVLLTADDAQELCLNCHGYSSLEDLYSATMTITVDGVDYNFNPHASALTAGTAYDHDANPDEYATSSDCASCHRSHEQSVMTCAKCHQTAADDGTIASDDVFVKAATAAYPGADKLATALNWATSEYDTRDVQLAEGVAEPTIASFGPSGVFTTDELAANAAAAASASASSASASAATSAASASASAASASASASTTASASKSATTSSSKTTSAAAGSYKDGTYTGTGTGMGGKINVTLEISGGKITVTDISPNNETKGIGGYEAIEDGTFASQIEAAQSADIEGVSGASVTSAAIKTAVQDALDQAAA